MFSRGLCTDEGQLFQSSLKPVMVHANDLSIWEAEAGECQFGDQPRVSHETPPQTAKKPI